MAWAMRVGGIFLLGVNWTSAVWGEVGFHVSSSPLSDALHEVHFIAARRPGSTVRLSGFYFSFFCSSYRTSSKFLNLSVPQSFPLQNAHNNGTHLMGVCGKHQTPHHRTLRIRTGHTEHTLGLPWRSSGWLRIHLPVQGTWVQSLVRWDSTCRAAAKPMSHELQLLKPEHLWPVLHNTRNDLSEKPMHCN